ncbi:hypothetical protein TrRE_jg1523 [Triparma retinervis]|uniref:Uncharacterized protein n=1 Tax=Triparma retinervis TaxID=2557542 RepID=A0A9W7EB25_9STRA|nr:hypothetical protein TrRE_jg1523 [Triparma retinervis]
MVTVGRLILGSLHTIPNDDLLFNLEVKDYTEEGEGTVEVQLPRGEGKRGGREGAKEYAEGIFKDGSGWEDALKAGADLAAFYSDLRNERKAEVTMALPKHIQKPRLAPLGAVKLREEEGTKVGNPYDVPEVCKEKREESGQGAWEMGGRRRR